jgi:hypothetical protein
LRSRGFPFRLNHFFEPSDLSLCSFKGVATPFHEVFIKANGRPFEVGAKNFGLLLEAAMAPLKNS